MANPIPPPGVSVDENMATAFHKKNVLKAGSAFMYSWFILRSAIAARGTTSKFPKNMKRLETFTMAPWGLPRVSAKKCFLRAAGLAQTRAGTDKPEFGRWWGDAPFGDDPVDQYWIKKGIRYARFRNY